MKGLLRCPDIKTISLGDSLAIQWLGLCDFITKDPSLIPDWGTKIPQAQKKNPQKHKKNTISLERNLFKKRESKGIAVEIRTEGRQLPLLDEGALSLTRG